MKNQRTFICKTTCDINLIQLSPGGRLVIPIGTKWGEQSLEVIDKINGSTIIRKKAMPVKFVPLTDKSIQIGTT